MSDKTKHVKLCPVCQKPIVWVRVSNATGKAKMAKMCDCGVFDKSGNKIETGE